MNYIKQPCFYPGDFAPPTKMHLNTLHWLLSKPEVGHVNVVIGASEPGDITQEQKKKLWEMLLRTSMAPQASILLSKDSSSIAEIYNLLSKKKDIPAFIALDEKTARNKKLQEKFEIFPNYQIELIPSQFKKSSERAMNAIANNDLDSLKLELPTEFTKDTIKTYAGILAKPQDPEAPEENSPYVDYREKYQAMFNDGFWKNVFSPIAESSEINEDFIKKHSHKKESLNEIADSPYTLSEPKESKLSNFDIDVDYTFNTDAGREYYIRFRSSWAGRSKRENQKYNWATKLTFSPSELKQTGDDRSEVGDENFGKILASVADAFKKFVQKYKPEYVYWEGIKSDKETSKAKTGDKADITKRQRIYNAFMNREVSKFSNYKGSVGNIISSMEYKNEIPVNGADDIFKYPEQPSMHNKADADKRVSRFKLSR